MLAMVPTPCRLFFKVAVFLLFVALIPTVATAQFSCNEIKKTKITIEHASPEEFHKEFYKLQACGFDSIDCKIAISLAGIILFKKPENESKPELTFGEVILQLTKFKQNALYSQARDEIIAGKTVKKNENESSSVIDYSTLCEIPILKDTFDSFNNLPQYFDYKQALSCARSKGKILFVYFTGHACANARKIEDEVLVDQKIQRILTDNFIIVSLFVDHRGPIGKENLAHQERFGSSGQPAFYGINNQEMVIAHHIGYTNKDTFIKFLHLLVNRR